MGLVQEVQQTFLAIVNTGNVRYRRWPANAAGVTTTGDKANLGKFGAWKEVVAKATIADPSWLWGVALGGAIGTDTEEEYAIDAATGEAGAEVSLSGSTGIVGTGRNIVGAAGGYTLNPMLYLPFPIRITGQPRLAVALAQMSDAAANHTLNIALFTAQALGT